jgi:uncharacterized protein
MFLAIDPGGDIYACQRFCGKPEYRLGNIAQQHSMIELQQNIWIGWLNPL